MYSISTLAVDHLLTIDIRSVEWGICTIATLYLLWIWFSWVTWRHQSRDHFARNMRFRIGGQL